MERFVNIVKDMFQQKFTFQPKAWHWSAKGEVKQLNDTLHSDGQVKRSHF